MKGPGRPLQSLSDRIRVISALAAVDAIVVFDDDTAVRLVEAVRPHVFVKGAPSLASTVPEAAVVRRAGGVVQFLSRVPDRSTAGLIARIRSADEAVAGAAT